jgi:DedD protein
MERQLLERMVGAGVLITALVVIGPAILDGERPEPQDTGRPPAPADEQRTHTVRLNDLDTTAGSPRASPPKLPTPLNTALPPPGTTAPSPVAATSTPPVAPKNTAVPPATDVVRAPAAKPAVSKPVTPAAKPEAEPAPERPTAPASAGWFVQVGTFGQRENAERLATQLKGLGFSAAVSAMQRDGKSMHRVRVGPAVGRSEAQALAARLAAAGHRGQVVPP